MNEADERDVGIYIYMYMYDVLVYIDEDYHTCTCTHTPLYTLVKGKHHAAYFTAYIYPISAAIL